VEQMDGVSKQLLNPHSQTFLVDFLKLPLQPWVTKSSGKMLPQSSSNSQNNQQKEETKNSKSDHVKSDEDKIIWAYKVLIGLDNFESLQIMDLLSAIRAHKLVITLIVSRFNDIRNSRCADVVAGGASRELETFNKWMGIVYNFAADILKILGKSEQSKTEKADVDMPQPKGKQDRKRPLSVQKNTDMKNPEDEPDVPPPKRQKT